MNWQEIVNEIDAYQERCNRLVQMTPDIREGHKNGILDVLHIIERMTSAKSKLVDVWANRNPTNHVAVAAEAAKKRQEYLDACDCWMLGDETRQHCKRCNPNN